MNRGCVAVGLHMGCCLDGVCACLTVIWALPSQQAARLHFFGPRFQKEDCGVGRDV